MNHIHALTASLAATRATLADAADELQELLAYLASGKFDGPDADYVHVRTDLMPKLLRLRLTMQGEV